MRTIIALLLTCLAACSTSTPPTISWSFPNLDEHTAVGDDHAYPQATGLVTVTPQGELRVDFSLPFTEARLQLPRDRWLPLASAGTMTGARDVTTEVFATVKDAYVIVTFRGDERLNDGYVEIRAPESDPCWVPCKDAQPPGAETPCELETSTCLWNTCAPEGVVPFTCVKK